MTRQKREILKRIGEIENFVQADMELGCGFAPVDAYKEEEHEAYRLMEQLAKLSHYKSVEDMMCDMRGCIYC